jgi:hypothetical protein
MPLLWAYQARYWMPLTVCPLTTWSGKLTGLGIRSPEVGSLPVPSSPLTGLPLASYSCMAPYWFLTMSVVCPLRCSSDQPSSMVTVL